MAKLITSAEEKAAASFLDWDDASLGAFCKKVALNIKTRRDAMRKDGLDSVINAADAMLLVGSVVDMNAESLELVFGDFTHNGMPAGDWELKIRRLPKKKRKK